jgi:hypothetical protein
MNTFLLPYTFKWIGALLVLSGLAGLACYTWFDFRIVIPVFAVCTSFFETRMFATFTTNAADELIMLSLLAGFFLMAFSKEKTESDNLDKIRTRAFSKAIIFNSGLLAFSIIFFYGNAFLAMLLLNIISVFMIYLCFFYFLKRKEIK